MSDMLEYKGYLGSVEYSEADGVFHGRVLGITDHITYEGESVRKLKDGFEEAVEDYFEGCVEVGKNPEKPCGGNLNLRIHPDVHRKLVYYSAASNQALDKIVEEAIGRYVALP